MAQALTIGQLAQATGVSAKTIRYSEQVGVLPRPVPVGTVKLSRLRYGNRG
jgi:DNA-binding transcriptional MerR regulator